MRLLIFGGSFNPIHIGHLILAEEARISLGYTHVALVPVYRRPLKDLQSDPGPEARLDMTRAAARGDPALLVWDGEIKREGLSYSIDTVRELVRAYDLEEKPGLLVGDDLLSGFHQWKDADVLSREARIVCARREHAERLSFPYEHVYLDNLLIPVSSRLIRERIATGRPYRRLVPDAVWRILLKKKYYRRDKGEKSLARLVNRLEKAAEKNLSRERREHSRSCALFAAEVCAWSGLDPLKGLAAGWAHDLAKELPVDLQRTLALECPVPPPATIFQVDKLLHGPAAATLLAKDYEVRDRDILEAVALHSVGRVDMGILAKIIWAADKMEEGRRHVDAELSRRCRALPPDELFLEALEATVVWRISRGKPVAPETLDLYNTLRKNHA